MGRRLLAVLCLLCAAAMTQAEDAPLATGTRPAGRADLLGGFRRDHQTRCYAVDTVRLEGVTLSGDSVRAYSRAQALHQLIGGL